MFILANLASSSTLLNIDLATWENSNSFNFDIWIMSCTIEAFSVLWRLCRCLIQSYTWFNSSIKSLLSLMKTTIWYANAHICWTVMKRACASASREEFVAWIDEEPCKRWVHSLLCKNHPTPAGFLSFFHEASTWQLYNASWESMSCISNPMLIWL